MICKDNSSILLVDPSACAIPIARSLYRKNIDFTLATQDNVGPLFFSRHKYEKKYLSSPLINRDCYLKNLIRILKSKRYVTIFPIGDESLLPISSNREKLEPYTTLLLPPQVFFEKTVVKSELLSVAEKLDIPTPKSHRAKNYEEIRAISNYIHYPVIVKAKTSPIWTKNGVAVTSKPHFANSPKDLLQSYQEINNKFGFPIVQEYIPGYNIDLAVLFDQGKPKAGCSIKEERTIPITGGMSVFRETVPTNPEVLRYTLSLGKELHWHGLVETEYRFDQRDSTFKVMEANPRFWGSTNLAIASGVDFPYLLYLLAKGETVPNVFDYRIGVKARWLMGDMHHLLSTLKNKTYFTEQTPSKSRTLVNFLSCFPKNPTYDYFTYSDLLPFFADIPLFLLKHVKQARA